MSSPLRNLANLLITLCFLLVAVLSATAQTLSQYDVEAAYLYDFGKFVRWPATAPGAATFDICILGQDPFGKSLDRLIANDRIDSKPIRKRILAQPSEAGGCSIIYIADSQGSRLRAIITALANKPALLVSELPNFVDDGGTVQFLIENHHVRFEINLDSASKCGISVSSELLRVAVSVTGRNRGVR